MKTDPSLNAPAEDDEISLLDLALTVAENLRLLIIGPIAAGLIALGVSSFPPQDLRERRHPERQRPARKGGKSCDFSLCA